MNRNLFGLKADNICLNMNCLTGRAGTCKYDHPFWVEEFNICVPYLRKECNGSDKRNKCRNNHFEWKKISAIATKENCRDKYKYEASLLN